MPLTPTPNDELMAQIMKRLDFHSERLNKNDRATENMVQIAKVVERLDAKLNGNGSIGLDEQVRINKHDIEGHKMELNALKDVIKSIQPMIMFYKVGVWFASAIGLSIIALIWGLLTGQASLDFTP